MGLSEEEEEATSGKAEAEAVAEKAVRVKVKAVAVAVAKAAAAKEIESALCAESAGTSQLNVGSIVVAALEVPSPPTAIMPEAKVAKAAVKARGKAKAVKVVRAKAKAKASMEGAKVATEAEAIKAVAG